MRKIGSLITSAVFFVSLMGCSVSMAAKCPAKLDVTQIKHGLLRGEVAVELGRPAFSGKDAEGYAYDSFSTPEGCNSVAKSLRAFCWGLLDVATLGLAELILLPSEGAIQADKVKVLVTYDKQERVKYVQRR